MRLGIALVTIMYALAVLFAAGLVMTLQGDCWAGTTDLEARACGRHAGFLGISVIAIGVIIYVAAWRWAKKRW